MAMANPKKKRMKRRSLNSDLYRRRHQCVFIVVSSRRGRGKQTNQSKIFF